MTIQIIIFSSFATISNIAHSKYVGTALNCRICDAIVLARIPQAVVGCVVVKRSPSWRHFDGRTLSTLV